MKKRLLFSRLSQNLKGKEALVITGMRQVGKTTLMRQVFDTVNSDTKLWFDFDNPLEQKTFEDIDYRNIYSRLKQMVNQSAERIYVFIDEIQNFPEITKIIKYLIDHYSVKFVVTGSSNYYLKNLFPESLSGRKFLYELSPLNFKEYLFFKDKISQEEANKTTIREMLKPVDIIRYKKFEQDYQDYLQFGGFPEVVVTTNFDGRKQILKNIFSSFFEKDIKILSDYKDIKELRDLILLLAPRVGSMLDITKIASELAVARPKIYSYLELLQGTFLIRLLPKFSRSLDRSIAGGKKIYFNDNGLLNTIGMINSSQLLENSIINQLSFYGNLSFYNKRNTAEIDAILNKEYALEVKQVGTDNDLKGLRKISQLLGLKNSLVISQSFVGRNGFIPALAI